MTENRFCFIDYLILKTPAPAQHACIFAYPHRSGHPATTSLVVASRVHCRFELYDFERLPRRLYGDGQRDDDVTSSCFDDEQQEDVRPRWECSAYTF
jgi:hypothetical protein